jgi:hypothetical protein
VAARWLHVAVGSAAVPRVSAVVSVDGRFVSLLA